MDIKTKNTFKRRLVYSITFILVAIYASFLTINIHSGLSEDLYSKYAKYLCIVLCFVLTLFIGKDGHNKKSTRLLQLAFLLTMIADFCIGIMGQFLPGIGVFFFVQIVYILRHREDFKFNRKEVITASIIYLTVIIILIFIGRELLKAGEVVTFAAIVVYALVLGSSLWMAIGTIWRGSFKRIIGWFIAVGMCFFFLCDINVGLSHALPTKVTKSEKLVLFENKIAIAEKVVDEKYIEVKQTYIKIPFTLQSVTGILVWFFYLPAQILLALSGYKLTFLRSVNPLIEEG